MKNKPFPLSPYPKEKPITKPPVYYEDEDE